MSEISTLSRQQLYDLVWKVPVDTLAKELGVNVYELGRLCKRYSVPTPSRGYWARKAAGRASTPGALAEVDHALDANIVMPAIRRPKPPVEKPPSALFRDLWHEQTRSIKNIRVPQKLVRPHRIIARWMATEFPRREDLQDGQPRSGARVEEQHDTPLASRRLRILNALFRRLEALGLAISEGSAQPDLVVRGEYGEVTFRLGEWIREYRRPLTLEESRGSPHKIRKWRYVQEATGLLEFRITSPQPNGVPDRWHEIDNTIEDMLPQIVGAITVNFALARQRKEERDANRKLRLERQAQKRKLAEEERRAAEFRKEVLRKQAAAWSEANDLRGFVAAVREAVLAGSSFVPRDQLDEWTAWALQQADELDPLSEAKLDED